MCGEHATCNPIGLLARCMGTPIVPSILNLILNMCSLFILIVAAFQNFKSAGQCGDSFRAIDAYSGGGYATWIWFGGTLATILAILNVLETVLDAALDFCMEEEDQESILGWVDYSLRVIKSVKKYYMLITNAVEPMFLIYFTFHASQDTVNALLNQEAKTAIASAMEASKTCVSDRYKVIANTGVGAVLATIQTAVRNYLDVGKYVQKEIEGEAGDTVKHYSKAYERAKSVFGPVGAAIILIGYSDEYEDLELIARAAVEEPEMADMLAQQVEMAGQPLQAAHQQYQSARELFP